MAGRGALAAANVLTNAKKMVIKIIQKKKRGFHSLHSGR